MATSPIFLGTADVCRTLRMNKSTLTRWVGSGRITVVQKLPGKNGAYLFDPAEVERVRAELAAAVPLRRTG